MCRTAALPTQSPVDAGGGRPPHELLAPSACMIEMSLKGLVLTSDTSATKDVLCQAGTGIAAGGLLSSAARSALRAA
jgi:hypothetical protein